MTDADWWLVLGVASQIIGVGLVVLDFRAARDAGATLVRPQPLTVGFSPAGEIDSAGGFDVGVEHVTVVSPGEELAELRERVRQLEERQAEERLTIRTAARNIAQQEVGLAVDKVLDKLTRVENRITPLLRVLAKPRLSFFGSLLIIAGLLVEVGVIIGWLG